MKAAKLADVAKAAKVSQGTASNVFNRPELVRPEVRARVEECARQLGYSGPDPKGRMLRAGKVNAIGVVVNERLAVVLRDAGAVSTLSGIAEICDAKGAGMALVSGYPEDETPGWNIKTALVDGFIVIALDDDNRLIGEARGRKLPFVAVDFDVGPDVPSVRIDDRGGARAAAEHLVALGHRNFGILSLELRPDGRFGRVDAERLRGARYAVTRDRLAGYGDALAAGGVDIEAVPILETLNSRKAGAEAAAQLLRSNPETTAILAMTDLMALGVLDHAREAGIAVPGRLSVIGFDGIPEAAFADPPLTTVAQPIREKGKRAATLIFEKGPPTAELLGVELIVRQSTVRTGGPGVG